MRTGTSGADVCTSCTMMNGAMDIGVVVAIGILSAVFIAALIALVVVLKRRYCKPVDLITQQYLDSAYVLQQLMI